MNTPISSKLAALAVTLMMNSLLLGGVAYVFSAPLHPHRVMSVAHTALSTLNRSLSARMNALH